MSRWIADQDSAMKRRKWVTSVSISPNAPNRFRFCAAVSPAIRNASFGSIIVLMVFVDRPNSWPVL